MNKELTESIAYHIFAGFGLLPSPHFKLEKSQSLRDKFYQLSEKLSFVGSDDKPITRNIFGCQIKAPDGRAFKILLGDCSIEKSVPEYAMIVSFEDSPVYGVYLVFNRLVDDPPDAEAMIGVSTDKKNWIICNTYLQATFLAGMEHLKELGSPWQRCENYQEQYQLLQSLIRFHSMYFSEDMNEGKEV